MGIPLLYSLPPAGQKIPLLKIWGDFNGINKNSPEELLEPLRNYLGTKYLIYLNSGRTSLWLLLKTLSKIHPGKKEVILPAYTCPAIASAVLKAGLVPILCDNNLEDFGLLISDLEGKINDSTLAIIVVHLFGYPANLHEVKKKCEKLDTFVIEDSAQSFGNTFLNQGDKKLGLEGDAGFYSFGRGKPITLLHGGLLVIKSEKIYEEALKIYQSLNVENGLNYLNYKLKLSLYSIFSSPYLYWIPQRIPFLHLGETIFEPDFEVSKGMDLSVVLISKLLKQFEFGKEIRRENSKWYSENLGENRVGRVDDYPYLRFPFFVKDKRIRNRLLDKLTFEGTGAALFYPCPLNELEGLREILNDKQIYPNAKKIADTLITLPVHIGVTPQIRKKIKKIILS